MVVEEKQRMPQAEAGIDEKLKLAEKYYVGGYTCSQAVFCAFAEDLGLDGKTAYRIMEGFGGGFGARQEVCGAFSAATAVISYYMSSGSLDGKSKVHTRQSAGRLKFMNRNTVPSGAVKSCMETAPKRSNAG
ncbi:MAG: C-GCAxxG-C-C family protein [Blautia sp.]|nr:C-GCAxxG-C-C family protein [Blautia sp.]